MTRSSRAASWNALPKELRPPVRLREGEAVSAREGEREKESERESSGA